MKIVCFVICIQKRGYWSCVQYCLNDGCIKNCVAKTLDDSVISGDAIKRRIPLEIVSEPHQLLSREFFWKV